MEKPERHDRSRIDYIDGLRALAVLTVIVAHCATHGSVAQGAVRHVLLEGAHGVDLFFVLSGFCLAFPTLKRYRSGEVRFDVTEFMTKRIVRICPPFYIATLALVAIALGAAALHHPLVAMPSPIALVASLLFLDGHAELINNSFWTLMVEFRWYFAFPVLLYIWLRSPRAFVAIALASVVLYHFTRAHGLDLGTLPGFMSGIVAADLFVGARLAPSTAQRLKRLAPPLLLLGTAAGIAAEGHAWIPAFAFADVRWPYQPTIVGWQIAVFAFVVAAGEYGWARRLLSARALVATGVASYGIYLVHEPVIVVVDQRLPGWGGFVAAGVVALACGFAFWFLAERPFTTGPLRPPLLDRVRPLIVRAAAVAGVPASFRVRHEPAQRLLPPALPQTQPLAEALY